MSHKDPMIEYFEALSDAEIAATNLFVTISKELGADEARRIFRKIIKQPTGQKISAKNQNFNGFLLALHKLGATNIPELARWVYKNIEMRDEEGNKKPSKLRLSEKSIEKQIRRLLKKARDK